MHRTNYSLQNRHKNLFYCRKRFVVKQTGKCSAVQPLSTINKSGLKDLGLPGISTFCNPRINVFKRIFWGCLWFTGFICCFLQCKNSLMHFRTNPATVNVKYRYNRSLTAPLLTLCAGEPYYRHPGVSPILLKERTGNGTYQTAYDLLSTTNVTINELWNISRFVTTAMGYGIAKISLTDGFNYLEENVTKLELITIHGVCLTFKLNMPLECTGLTTGMVVYAEGQLPDPNAYFSQFIGVYHTEAETPLVRYFGGIISGFYVTYAHYTRRVLRINEVIHISTSQNPCQSEEESVACLERCMKRIIAAECKLNPCRLPYMEDTHYMQPCQTAAEFLDMYVATERAILQVTLEMCGCVHPCRKLRYVEEFVEKDATNLSLFEIYTSMPHCDFEVIEDELNYDFTAFFSDLGGGLGLFLGMSVLSILEVLEFAIWKVVNLKLFVL